MGIKIIRVFSVNSSVNQVEYFDFIVLDNIVVFRLPLNLCSIKLSKFEVDCSMFQSQIFPGKLPNIVTVDNIKDTRYARNPRISRVLTDFGWVRELNEGVKRIYSDMADFF